jgi:hypothetical protein
LIRNKLGGLTVVIPDGAAAPLGAFADDVVAPLDAFAEPLD